MDSRRPLRLVMLLTACFLLGSRPESGGAIGQESAPKISPRAGRTSRARGQSSGARKEPSPEIRRAIRDLLSSDPKVSARGERTLKRAGRAALEQLSYWVERVRLEVNRVDRLRQEIAAAESAASPPAASPLNLTASDYFHRKFLAAKDDLKKGSYDRAREIGEAILSLDPDTALKFELHRLIKEARERQMVRELEPTIDVGDLVYEIGAEPRVVFRLYNRSRRNARVQIRAGYLGRLEIIVTRLYRSGESKRTRLFVDLRTSKAASQLELKPGARWENEISSGLGDNLPKSGMIGRVQFRFTFRPTRWELEGEKDSNIPLRAAPAEFWVVPRGHKLALEDPLKRLKTALVFRRPDDFLIAGWMAVWAGEKDGVYNARLVKVLARRITEMDPPLQRISQKLLEAATGERFKTAADWAQWWASHPARRGGTSVPASETSGS